jgi:hypothetical protein
LALCPVKPAVVHEAHLDTTPNPDLQPSGAPTYHALYAFTRIVRVDMHCSHSRALHACIRFPCETCQAHNRRKSIVCRTPNRRIVTGIGSLAPKNTTTTTTKCRTSRARLKFKHLQHRSAHLRTVTPQMFSQIKHLSTCENVLKGLPKCQINR